MPEAAELKATTIGICLKCRGELPLAHFRKNAAGSYTAWCNSCRTASAMKWGIDDDLVELAHALYVFELSLKQEAAMVAGARAPVDVMERQKALAAHGTAVQAFERLRPTRIPERLRRILQEYRAGFYFDIGMEAPEAVVPDELMGSEAA